MSVRIRLIYSKRGAACFVPHIALAQIFARSASRAGFSLEVTQGFSPRPKLSFGPELPAGVVALHEPVDVYFADMPVDVVDALNRALPEGFCVSDALFPQEGSPNLGKFCTHAEYFIRISRGSVRSDDNSDIANNINTSNSEILDVVRSHDNGISVDNNSGVVSGANTSIAGSNNVVKSDDNDTLRAANNINTSASENLDVARSHDNGISVDNNSGVVSGANISIAGSNNVVRSDDNGFSTGQHSGVVRDTNSGTLRTDNNVNLAQYAGEFYGQAAALIKYIDGWVKLITKSPAQFPIGGLVKYLISNNIISGWHEINIVRNAVGIYQPSKGCVTLNA